jgi:DNA-directed RNA polymerase specialized sigma24 family protein
MDFSKQLTDLKRQQGKAQQWLFEYYGKTMYALCRRYLSPAEEAEEAMMNGFLKVFIAVKEANFSNEPAFAGWMRKIMVELFAMIEDLPTGYRTVFNLYVIEGYTHKEIAGMMQISEGASKSQLSKARIKLAQWWKQKNDYYGLGKAR